MMDRITSPAVIHATIDWIHTRLNRYLERPFKAKSNIFVFSVIIYKLVTLSVDVTITKFA